VTLTAPKDIVPYSCESRGAAFAIRRISTSRDDIVVAQRTAIIPKNLTRLKTNQFLGSPGSLKPTEARLFTITAGETWAGSWAVQISLKTV